MRIKIKICGMKFQENISEIAGLQPDYLGFIFYDKSLRQFENNIPNLPKSIQKVGVFVNATFGEIEEKVKYHELESVQLHGDESPEFCALIESKLVKVIKAFNMHKEFNFNDLKKYKSSCSYYLFDTRGSKHGGNGNTFDWNILEKYQLNKPYFLSGGISTESIIALKEFFKKEYARKCVGIDLNSKFETEPGLKNSKNLATFIKTLKQQL
jgi:phosphoribosylanthranilate isomerase